jgi:methionine-rich copper-binding protein CopC
MTFVTRRHLARRSFLKAVGATIALPFLDAMVPAFARAEITKPPVRMAFMYV